METSRAADQRHRVLEAALDAIAEVGVDGLRMTDIAERAGMTPGHILYYFGRKDRILVETLRWSEEDLAARRRASLARIRDQRRKVERFIDLYLPAGPNDTRWNLWTQLLFHRTDDEETVQLLADLNDLWRDDLTGILNGDAERALRLCYLMDGLAWDMLGVSPALTHARACAIARSMLDA
jgi:AcrR family transcriptional regulator